MDVVNIPIVGVGVSTSDIGLMGGVAICVIGLVMVYATRREFRCVEQSIDYYSRCAKFGDFYINSVRNFLLYTVSGDGISPYMKNLLLVVPVFFLPMIALGLNFVFIYGNRGMLYWGDIFISGVSFFVSFVISIWICYYQYLLVKMLNKKLGGKHSGGVPYGFVGPY